MRRYKATIIIETSDEVTHDMVVRSVQSADLNRKRFKDDAFEVTVIGIIEGDEQ